MNRPAPHALELAQQAMDEEAAGLRIRRLRAARGSQIGLRNLAKAGAAAAIGTGLLHILQQCIAGYVQCRVLGCLPW